MRQTIELLRKQSIQAGLTQAHMQSMGVQVNVNGSSAKIVNGSPTKTNGQQEQQQQLQQNGNMQRQHSTDSMCSVNSNGSNGSSSQEKKKKKGWVCLHIFMSSFIFRKYLSIVLFDIISMYSFEVPSQKLSHVMPKLPRQIAKQIIPIRNHHYLPHHKRIRRQQCMARMEPLESYRPQKVHIGIFRLWKMPNL